MTAILVAGSETACKPD